MWVVGAAVGPVVISHNTDGAQGVGDAGAYLVLEGDHVKLVEGFVWSPSVSSDGCRLAFLHGPGYMPLIAETDYWVSLRSIDLCAVSS